MVEVQLLQIFLCPEIKIGCLSWCFHTFAPGADQEAAIDAIGPLGFDGIELILLARQDLKDWWTDVRIDNILRCQADVTNGLAPDFFLYTTRERIEQHGILGPAWRSSKQDSISLVPR